MYFNSLGFCTAGTGSISSVGNAPTASTRSSKILSICPVYSEYEANLTTGCRAKQEHLRVLAVYIYCECSQYTSCTLKYFEARYCRYCLYSGFCTAHTPSTRSGYCLYSRFCTAYAPSTRSIWAASTPILLTQYSGQNVLNTPSIYVLSMK